MHGLPPPASALRGRAQVLLVGLGSGAAAGPAFDLLAANRALSFYPITAMNAAIGAIWGVLAHRIVFADR